MRKIKVNFYLPEDKRELACLEVHKTKGIVPITHFEEVEPVIKKDDTFKRLRLDEYYSVTLTRWDLFSGGSEWRCSNFKCITNY